MRPPRYDLVSATEPGYYHCISRCVRRAFLCGDDGDSGRSFDHRKQWIENRLFELADIFAVAVYAYAVMSNHVHVVVYVDPPAAAQWSAEDVAERWVRLCPACVNGEVDAHACRVKQTLIAADPIRVDMYRKRLTDLAWFMRCLNEPIARRANREDACTGRFWEGRYRCQALLDDAAVLACMAYVDLNPIRARVATDLPTSAHTSIRWRLHQTVDRSVMLKPVAGTAHAASPLDHSQYVQLVDWTGRRCHPDKHGRIAASAPAALTSLGIDTDDWCRQVSHIETGYWRAIGSVMALVEKAKVLGQCWLKGGGTNMQSRRVVRAWRLIQQ